MSKTIPILFSTVMVKALLAGRKTMTRRLIKPQPEHIFAGTANSFILQNSTRQVGDTLYVREAYYAFGVWVKNGKTKTGKTKWKFVDKTLAYGAQHHFVADGKPDSVAIHTIRDGEVRWYKRPSLFMPKSIARIFLKITCVGVENASDITEIHAISEGIQAFSKDGSLYKYGIDGWDWDTMPRTAKDAFKRLWDEINGPETWENWVFVYSFEVTKPESRYGTF